MDMGRSKRVAVIGAGASGLPSIKACLEEGLHPVCFERSDGMGGLWKHKEEAEDGYASAMHCTTINSSKEMMAYSDFPPPTHFPNHMHHSFVLRYLEMYAEKFDLLKYIRFETRVIQVAKSDDFEKSGRWLVTTEDRVSGHRSTQVFDAVLVCTGHHAERYIPQLPGAADFRGKVMHTHDYRAPYGFDGKTVAIIGMGNSAGDMAVDVAQHAKQVYVSTRRGNWLLKRTTPSGMPGDIEFGTRFLACINHYAPNTVNDIVEKRCLAEFDHEKYGLRPSHRFNGQHPFVNDFLPGLVINGRIRIKPDISSIHSNGITFVDGSVINDVDVLVYGTGYHVGFPVLAPGIVGVEDNQVELYCYIFPPHLQHHTLAIVGCVQPLGATINTAEMQARWAARVISGNCQLPSKNEMLFDIMEKRAALGRRFVASRRHTVQVDKIPYMDEIAGHVGCKPNLARLWLCDPALACKCFFGPCTSYQFRLQGPHAWHGARDAIMTTMQRVIIDEPINRRLTNDTSNGRYILAGVVGLAVAMGSLYFWMQ